MRLAKAATFFNRTPCYDAYTGALLFQGQLVLSDDSKGDAEASERRILELAPGTPLPARRTITFGGYRYILGHGYPDWALGSTIRETYVVHEATALASVQTLAQVCTNTAGTSAYAARAWLRDARKSGGSSTLVGVNHFHFAVGEPVGVNAIVTFEGQYHIVRKTVEGVAGTLIATCDEIPSPAVEIGTLKSGTYDPVTEIQTASDISVRVVRLPWQSLFEHRDQLAPPFMPDEMQVVMAKSVATPAVGNEVVLSDGTWWIGAILDEGDVWVCRVSHHA